MRNLNTYDTVRLTSMIKNSVLQTSQEFALLSSGDRVSIIPHVFGQVSTLKIYFNMERIETHKADFMTDGDISIMSIVSIIETLDKRVTSKLAKEYNN